MGLTKQDYVQATPPQIYAWHGSITNGNLEFATTLTDAAAALEFEFTVTTTANPGAVTIETYDGAYHGVTTSTPSVAGGTIILHGLIMNGKQALVGYQSMGAEDTIAITMLNITKFKVTVNNFCTVTGVIVRKCAPMISL